MKPESLNDIKKELVTKDLKELTEICIRLVRYKKENKELMTYLLFRADDPLQYAEMIKSALEEDFKTLSKHYYYSIKTLRKILRILNRHIKYTGSKQVEVELIIWFCKSFLTYADTKSSYKPLKKLFIRQMERINNLILKLHEDLQFDYRIEFDALKAIAGDNMKETPKKRFPFL